MEMLIEFAKNGLGVSCVIEDFVKNELAQKQLYKVSIKEKIPERFLAVAIIKICQYQQKHRHSLTF